MQTFLPYQSFYRSAQVLDPKRLSKQRVEAMQIIGIVSGTATSNAWKNHPAVRMWRDHLPVLKIYYNCICQEWIRRGYRQFMPLFRAEPGLWDYPPWLTPEFCLAHQSNLIRKFPEHYQPIFGQDIPDDLPYIWPV